MDSQAELKNLSESTCEKGVININTRKRPQRPRLNLHEMDRLANSSANVNRIYQELNPINFEESSELKEDEYYKSSML